MNWTIPNLLSVIRVLAAPCVALAFVAFERPEADRIAVLIFIGAAATDFFDGWLARILRQESAIGKMLDPIADKALVIIALAIVVALYDMIWQVMIPAVLIMTREVLISGLREFLGDVKLQVTRLAKWKTTLQMSAICLLLVRGAAAVGADAGPMHPVSAGIMASVATGAGAIGILVLWIAAWLTIVSGWYYFGQAMPYIREKERAVANPAPAAEIQTRPED